MGLNQKTGMAICEKISACDRAYNLNQRWLHSSPFLSCLYLKKINVNDWMQLFFSWELMLKVNFSPYWLISFTTFVLPNFLSVLLFTFTTYTLIRTSWQSPSIESNTNYYRQKPENSLMHSHLKGNQTTVSLEFYY